MSVPPSALAPDTFAERLYLALAPLARQDIEHGWSLLVLCNAIGTMYQPVEDLVRDTPAGPGWSPLLDLDRCPDFALPWLGQFAGVRVLAGSTPDQMRARIGSTDGFKRGTPAAMRGAAQATLTGAKTVVFRERDGANQGNASSPDYAYYLTAATYTAQTPNPAATHAALLAQKPGGIVLVYNTTAGQDYQTLRTNHATYNAVRTTYPSYDAVRNDTP
jgi:hypothetical protein